jgi:hypothetical protein
MRLACCLLVCTFAGAADFEPAQLIRLHPLGARAGTTVEVEILGTHLDTAATVEFDCADLAWKHTTSRDKGRLTGLVAIAPGAAAGGHMLRVRSADGPTTSLLFNVGQFPALIESDHRAVPSLPVEIYGRLDGPTDFDTYWITVKAGERWLFDLLAMDHGSAVETRMSLVDTRGERIQHNDDRDHFDENPLIDHTFREGGLFGVKLDQYRGPRGFTFGKNNAYILRISALPHIRWVSPLGARRGSIAKFRIGGSAIAGVRGAYLTELRRAEYSRMTYPHTMPVAFLEDPPAAASVGRIHGKFSDSVVEFAIPPDTRPGLWKLWLTGPAGTAGGPKIEISDVPEIDESFTARTLPAAPSYAINGVLARPGERDRYSIDARAGEPLHFWTLSAQLGAPYLDTVLTLRDPGGTKIVEADDVVAGYGGLLGNPDSSLFHTPAASGPLILEVRDRLGRGGPAFPYRLKFDRRLPGFQLFTTPENFTVRKGGAATIKVHLVREDGFQGEVEVWFEGLPPGVTAQRARFRADQLFEPNADGADMIIPEISFRLEANTASGVYPFRILGRATSGLTGEAHTATMIGPIYQGDWNFYRRPVPAITLTVLD